MIHQLGTEVRRPLMVATLVLAVAGCGKSPAPEPVDPPLARGGEVAITEEDFAFEIERRRSTGRPLTDPESIIQDLIERQAMLQAAAQSEVLNDPIVRRELENRQLGQWLDRSLQVERDAVRVTDEDLRAHYEDNIDRFRREGMARLAILYRQVQAFDPQEGTEELRAALASARAAFLENREAVTQQGRLQGFGTIAADASEDTISRYRGGDLGWLEFSALTNRIPLAVAESGLALAPGEVSDVIVVDRGVYVVMKSDERPATVTPFDEVAPTLRRRLIRIKQEEVERAFMSNLLAQTSIEINPERAKALQLPALEPPATPPVLRPLSEIGITP